MHLGLRIACCLSLATANVCGQDLESGAESLFRAGRAAMRADRVEEACARFRESLALEAALGTRLNLAICEEQLGHHVRAWHLLDELRRDMDVSDPRQSIVQPMLARLEATLAPRMLELEAGAPTDSSSQQTLVIAPGAPLTSELRLSSAPSGNSGNRVGSPGGATLPAPSELLPSTPHWDDDDDGGGRAALDLRRSVARVALGVGGTALVASLVNVVLILQQKRVVEEECTPLCSPRGLRAGERGRMFSALGTLSFVLGAAGVGTGAYLWLTEKVSVDVQAGAAASQLTLGGSF